MKINILVATVSQTAENIANAIAFEFNQQHDIKVQLFDQTSNIAMLEPSQFWLICSSTYNIGDVPENAAAFMQSFINQPRDLSNINYGVIALGDSTYSSTFANGGKQLDAAMQDLGAKRIGKMCILDANSEQEPELQAIEWFKSWLELLSHLN